MLHLVRTTVTGILVCLSAFGANVVQADDSKIVIPTTIVLTGPGAFTGIGWRAGAAMALDEINRQGGVNGKKIELSFIDTQGTPQGGIAAARKFIQEDKASFVLAAGTSTDVTASIPLFQNTFKDVPVLVSVASDPRVTEKFSRNVFSSGVLPQKYIVSSLVEQSTKQLKMKSVVIISCDQAWCISNLPLLVAEFSQRGVNVLKKLTYNAGDTDFTAQMRELTVSGAEAVFIDGFPPDGGRILKALAQANYKGKKIGMVTLSSNIILELAGSGAEGLYTAVIGASQHPNDETEPMKSWRAAFMKFMPDAPNSIFSLYLMLGYTDMYVAAEAYRRAGPNPTSEKLISALETFKGFVAGKDGNWKSAHPIGMPVSFSTTDHVGVKVLTPVVVANGKFQAP